MTALPSHTLKDAIRAEVAARLVVYARGRANAVTGERLAELVAAGLEERGHKHSLKPKTLQRRCQESVAELIERGEDIASTSTAPRGYFVPETREEYAVGEISLVRHLASSAKRLRRYRSTTADAILALLGQLGIALPTTSTDMDSAADDRGATAGPETSADAAGPAISAVRPPGLAGTHPPPLPATPGPANEPSQRARPTQLGLAGGAW
jgi:hypothetical protein